MTKFLRFMQTYLIYGVPFVIVCMIWSSIQPQNEIANPIAKLLWEVLAYNLMFWFLMLVVFLIMLVAIPSVREKTLRRLANLKERDEREAYITGKASRSAYISTLSLVLFFLFFSMVSLHVYRLPANQTDGKHKGVSISVGFSLLAKNQIENKSNNAETIFDSRNISLSTSTILFLILAWQLFIFNLTARKEQKY